MASLNAPPPLLRRSMISPSSSWPANCSWITLRTSAAALKAASDLSNALARQLERLADEEPPTHASGRSGCAAPWAHYCDFTYAAVEFAAARGHSVLLVSQPRLVSDAGRERHASQHQALADLAAREFSRNPHIRFVDLSGAIDLADTRYAFDGMHLTRDGNVIIAHALVEPVLSLAGAHSKQ